MKSLLSLEERRLRKRNFELKMGLEDKKSIRIIAAVGENGVIGWNGKLPWYFPEDLNYFKMVTHGHAVIMGRKTWESIPEVNRPLKGRQNIVVTRNASYGAPGAFVAHSLEEAIFAVDKERIPFIAGGETIYREALESDIVKYMHITHVNVPGMLGNVYFPGFERGNSPGAWSKQVVMERKDLEFSLYSFNDYE